MKNFAALQQQQIPPCGMSFRLSGNPVMTGHHGAGFASALTAGVPLDPAQGHCRWAASGQAPVLNVGPLTTDERRHTGVRSGP